MREEKCGFCQEPWPEGVLYPTWVIGVFENAENGFQALWLRLRSPGNPLGSLAGSGPLTFKGFSLFEVDEALDNDIEVTFHDGVKLVESQADTVVGDPLLRKIVGPDLFTSVARTDNGHPVLINLMLLFVLRQFIKAGKQNLHG